MNITNINVIVFSPTGTSRRVAMAVAEGLGGKQRLIDVTYSAGDIVKHGSQDLTIVAVPVYGGRVAPVAMQRLEALHGEQTAVVPIVVYGNRAYEGALTQLSDFLSEKGFVPIAAGAFVGEHSYSTPDTPIAQGRPDSRDLADARRWGKVIANKLCTLSAPQPIDVTRLQHPRNSWWATLRFVAFIMKQRRKKTAVKPVPSVDTTLCTGCNKCVRVCPVGAIRAHDVAHTDATKCIKCCACVKACPKRARTFSTPYAPILSRCFKQRKSPVTII